MLISLGLDYGFAPIGVRETFHRTDAEVRALYARPGPMVGECVFVRTCNRLELYGWTSGDPGTEAPFAELADRWTRDDAATSELLDLARRRSGRDAGRHLLRVAGGLESQILGDIHILGQLRKCFRLASDQGGLGSHLQRLFEAAFRAGKSVRRETELMAGRRSVGSEAAARALRGVTPADVRVIVVGCGKVGAHAARSLADHGVGELVLLNRSPERAHELASELGATAVSWDDRVAEIARSDVAIVATGAERPVIEVDGLADARASAGPVHRADPLLVIDLAMPRNVLEGSEQARGQVTLIDLDQLEPETASAERARQAAVPLAEALVEKELEAFFEWIAGEPAREALRPLREALTDICLKEIGYAADTATAERTAGRIVAKLMAGPMTRLQEACADGRSVDDLTRAMSDLFPGSSPNPESMHHATR